MSIKLAFIPLHCCLVSCDREYIFILLFYGIDQQSLIQLEGPAFGLATCPRSICSIMYSRPCAKAQTAGKINVRGKIGFSPNIRDFLELEIEAFWACSTWRPWRSWRTWPGKRKGRSWSLFRLLPLLPGSDKN